MKCVCLALLATLLATGLWSLCRATGSDQLAGNSARAGMRSEQLTHRKTIPESADYSKNLPETRSHYDYFLRQEDTVYKPELPPDTVYKPKLQLDTVYNPEPPPDTVYKPELPPDTVHKPELLPDTVYKPQLPLDTVYKPQLPLDTVYKPQLPLDTVYKPQLPLGTVYKPKFPSGLSAVEIVHTESPYFKNKRFTALWNLLPRSKLSEGADFPSFYPSLTSLHRDINSDLSSSTHGNRKLLSIWDRLPNTQQIEVMKKPKENAGSRLQNDYTNRNTENRLRWEYFESLLRLETFDLIRSTDNKSVSDAVSGPVSSDFGDIAAEDIALQDNEFRYNRSRRKRNGDSTEKTMGNDTSPEGNQVTTTAHKVMFPSTLQEITEDTGEVLTTSLSSSSSSSSSSLSNNVNTNHGTTTASVFMTISDGQVSNWPSRVDASTDRGRTDSPTVESLRPSGAEPGGNISMATEDLEEVTPGEKSRSSASPGLASTTGRTSDNGGSVSAICSVSTEDTSDFGAYGVTALAVSLSVIILLLCVLGTVLMKAQINFRKSFRTAVHHHHSSPEGPPEAPLPFGLMTVFSKTGDVVSSSSDLYLLESSISSEGEKSVDEIREDECHNVSTFLLRRESQHGALDTATPPAEHQVTKGHTGTVNRTPTVTEL